MNDEQKQQQQEMRRGRGERQGQECQEEDTKQRAPVVVITDAAGGRHCDDIGAQQQQQTATTARTTLTLLNGKHCTNKCGAERDSSSSNEKQQKRRRRKISKNNEEGAKEEGTYLMGKVLPTPEIADGVRGATSTTTAGTDGASPSTKFRQFVLNFLVIVGVAVSWALAVQFRKSTLVIDPSHFYAPFTLVWFSTGFMTICLPVFLLFAVGSSKNVSHELANALHVLRSPLGHFSVWHSLLCPLLFLCLWTVINYAYAQALGLISAGAASSIMSASTALVWALGWILLREQFSALKFVAVLVAMVGVVLVATDHTFSSDQSGIWLSILSTVVASFYKVLFKLCVGNASLGQVSLFMTILGLQNLLLNTCVSIVLLHLGWDHIEWDYVPWSPLIGSALLGLIFNFLVNFGIALLDPLVISIGMLFGMPLSASIDVLFRAMPISAPFLVGSLLITCSFVLIVFPIEFGMRNFCRR